MPFSFNVLSHKKWYINLSLLITYASISEDLGKRNIQSRFCVNKLVCEGNFTLQIVECANFVVKFLIDY